MHRRHLPTEMNLMPNQREKATRHRHLKGEQSLVSHPHEGSLAIYRWEKGDRIEVLQKTWAIRKLGQDSILNHERKLGKSRRGDGDGSFMVLSGGAGSGEGL